MARPPASPVPAAARVALAAGFCVLLLLAWALASAYGVLPATLLPGPLATLDAALQMVTAQDFAYDIALTVIRVVGGVVLAALIAVPVGIANGTSAWLGALLQGFFWCVRYPPATAVVPLLVLWFGVGELQKLAVIFLGAFLQLAPQVAAAIRATRPELVDVARTLGVGAGRVLGSVQFPAAAPAIAHSLRTVLAWSWGLAILSEFIGATRGIGHAIGVAQAQAATERIVVAIVAIGLLRLVFDALFRLFNRQLFPWTRA